MKHGIDIKFDADLEGIAKTRGTEAYEEVMVKFVVIYRWYFLTISRAMCISGFQLNVCKDNNSSRGSGRPKAKRTRWQQISASLSPRTTQVCGGELFQTLSI